MMKIKFIRINNFRCLENVEVTMKNNILALVGQNDVGKSTVIRALRVFFDDIKITEADFPYSVLEPKIEIEVHFETNEYQDLQHDGYLKLKRVFTIKDGRISEEKQCFSTIPLPEYEEVENYGYKELKAIGKTLNIDFPPKKPDNDTIEGLRQQVLDKLRQSSRVYDWHECNNWNEIKSHFPEVIFIPAAQDHENEQKLTNDSSAFGKLFRVGIRNWLKVDEQSRQALDIMQNKVNEINEKILNVVKEKFKEQMPIADDLIQKLDPLDVSKGFSFTLYVKDADGIETPLNQRGSGLQRAVLIAAIRAQNDINRMINDLKNESSKSGEQYHDRTTLYLFEEPEAFLHLRAQKELYYSFKDLTNQSNQIIFTTHSTLFIDEGELEDLVLLVRQNGRTISLQHIPSEEIRDELGEMIRISELITGKVCLIVEGQSDKAAFQVWMKTLGYDYKKLGIHIIPMDGCQNAEYYANAGILFDFRVPFILLLDRDSDKPRNSEQIKEYLENKHPILKKNNRIRILNGELENYFDLDAVSDVLRIPKEFIDLKEYRYDPKKALKNAKEEAEKHGVPNVKLYDETRDGRRIAEKMKKEDILKHSEIVSVIEELVRLASDQNVQ